MIAIIDYGVGNLFSLHSSLRATGAEVTVTDKLADILSADALILPGVGAFGDAAERLRATGLDRVITSEANKGKPLMGICLGMQLLFDRSLEYGEHMGLGLIAGDIVPLRGRIDSKLKVPHIGWNSLTISKKSPVLANVSDGDCVYFVHSFHATNCSDSITATAEYGTAVTAAVQHGNVFGCQFHPEKSGDVGLSILRSFCVLGGKV